MAADETLPQRSCPSCGEQIWKSAKVCRYCRADFGALGNAPRYLPILSVAVAFLAMAPKFIESVVTALHDPAAMIQIVGIRALNSTLELNLVNLGDATGITSGDLLCTTGLPEGRSLHVRFANPGNTIIKADNSVLLTFGSEVAASLSKEPAMPNSLLLDEGLQMTGLRAQIAGGFNQQLDQKINFPDPLGLRCDVPVAGQARDLEKLRFGLELGSTSTSFGYKFDLSP